MKTAVALVLIVLVGVLGWALPAGAEKALLSDDQLDQITAGKATDPMLGCKVSASSPVCAATTSRNATAAATAFTGTQAAQVSCTNTCKNTGTLTPNRHGTTIVQTSPFSFPFSHAGR